MGADMVFSYLVISKDTKPDFTAARCHLATMSPEEIHQAIIQSEGLEDNPDWISLDDARNMAEDAITIVEQGWNNERRDFVKLFVKEDIVLFSGEMSYGDAPEGSTAIERFCALDLDINSRIF